MPSPLIDLKLFEVSHGVQVRVKSHHWRGRRRLEFKHLHYHKQSLFPWFSPKRVDNLPFKFSQLNLNFYVLFSYLFFIHTIYTQELNTEKWLLMSWSQTLRLYTWLYDFNFLVKSRLSFFPDLLTDRYFGRDALWSVIAQVGWCECSAIWGYSSPWICPRPSSHQ